MYVWKDALWQELHTAGEEERLLAIEKGHVIENVPWITVYLDGGWNKRSYGHSYNAASGVAVIIGRATRKVLYVGIRNKYCSICARADNINSEPQAHICYKNWTGSSASMEADISSEEMHGLQYREIIADGNSSVFAKIREKVPYGKEVIYIDVIYCLKVQIYCYSGI
ncbi:cyclin [Holotrichia oblita]|uniref:Cyclin n=1 Tax=Holotrichia oblita TaxID=644536 RepID=A0ACB9TNN0_HOLOL|nr:cyclin [Holotrichia oblita]